MSVFGIILATAVLLIAAVIIYDIIVNQNTPQDAFNKFLQSDWSTRMSSLQILSDQTLSQISKSLR